MALQRWSLARSICIILSALVSQKSCLTVRDSVELSRLACPYSSYCTVGPELNFTASKDLVPCCTQCSCDADCWVYNDCCPDAENKRPERMVTCVSSLVKRPAFYQANLVKKYPSYRMFDTCPRYFTGSHVTVQNCNENYTTEVPDFGDVVFVSDSRYHDDIYKNRHCAVCHGVKDFVRWMLQTVNCPQVVDGDFPHADVHKYIWKHCLMYSIPSDELQFKRESLACGSSMVSTCQLPKTASQNYSELRDLCEHGNYAPVFLDLTFANIAIFKNPACMLCNLDEPNDSGLCPASISRNEKSFIPNGLTILIDTRPPESPESRDKDSRCCIDETFDHITNQCRVLYCPWNSHVHYGKCVTFSKSITNIQIRVKLLFRSSYGLCLDGNTHRYDIVTAEEFKREILGMLDLRSCNTSIFQMYAYRSHKTGLTCFVTIDFKIPPSGSCSYNCIAKNLKRHAFDELYINIQAGNQTVYWKGRLYFARDFSRHFLFDPALYDKKMLVLIMARTQLFAYTLEKFYICPYFTMNVQEYNSLITGGSDNQTEIVIESIQSTTILKPGFFVLSNSTIAICEDAYFELFSKNNVLLLYCQPSLMHVLSWEVFLYLMRQFWTCP